MCKSVWVIIFQFKRYPMIARNLLDELPKLTNSGFTFLQYPLSAMCADNMWTQTAN